jgi:large subunit ribosomal protein L25
MSTQEIIALDLKPRSVVGKAVKHLRKDGMVPAVIHDHGKDSVIVMGSMSDMSKAYKAAGKHHPVELTVGKVLYTALIKTAELDPKKNTLKHVVFNAVNANQTVEAEVPVRVDGDIPAEKAGLMVISQLDHVEVEALPKFLVDELTVDGTKLIEIGDKLTVADITAPEGVTILTEPEHPIATVEETKAQISEEEAAAEDGEEAEGGEEGSEESGEAEDKTESDSKEE